MQRTDRMDMLGGDGFPAFDLLQGVQHRNQPVGGERKFFPREHAMKH